MGYSEPLMVLVMYCRAPALAWMLGLDATSSMRSLAGCSPSSLRKLERTRRCVLSSALEDKEDEEDDAEEEDEEEDAIGDVASR